MAKRRKTTKKTQEKRGTNWVLIGGVVFVGVMGLFALLFLALRAPEPQATPSLAQYCSENAGSCVEIGEPDAPTTFVEVSDFGCSHCQAFHQEKSTPIKENYVDTGKIKWIFVPYALRAETIPAANAALCANEQNKYLEFSDAVYALPTQIGLTRDGFLIAAEEVGLDVEAFTTCVEEGRHNGTIGRNQQAARAARVSGTPTFFVNDEMVSGNVPMSEFDRLFSQ